MAIRNAKISEAIWYGLSTGIVFFGLSLYKPKYYYYFANVQHI
jgi:hypothetical protein